jgi:hypothetical protein
MIAMHVMAGLGLAIHDSHAEGVDARPEAGHDGLMVGEDAD